MDTHAEHVRIRDVGITTLTFTLVAVVLVAAFMLYVMHSMNKIMRKVERLTDSSKMAAMVASGAKGITEGLGAAVAAITCTKQAALAPIPQRLRNAANPALEGRELKP